jgi:DNA-binding transcriptional MerR regulator
MADSLPIREVARRTGLSSRALRFYEARGLVAPLRTGSGRRVFGRGDLERLGRIVALKQAGFSLADIAKILDGDGGSGLSRVLTAQLAAIEAQQANLQSAADTLRRALSRIDDGERLDAETLCSLIDKGKLIMTEKKQWDELSGRYLSEQGKADFAAAPFPEGFDQEACSAQWAALGTRIKAALPLDPASEEAKTLLGEWKALLAPFAAMATPAMMGDVSRMYSDMPNWGKGAPSPGFDQEVWQFIQAAGACGDG